MARKPVALPQLVGHTNLKPPKIPKPFVWTASSMKLFKTCKRKWYWKYIYRLRTKYQGAALIVGSAVHSALEKWYAGKRSSLEIIARRWADNALEIFDAEGGYYDEDDYKKKRKEIQTVYGMLVAYEQMYDQDRQDWKYTRKNIERGFKVKCEGFEFWGKMDLFASRVSRKRRINFLVDHKTASKIDENFIGRLPLDTQMRGYVYGAQKDFGLQPNEVVYDVIKKCKLRGKSNETQKEFDERIALDYCSRPSFYYHREYLKYSQNDVRAFEEEMYQCNSEFQHILKQPGFLDPRSWLPNDGACWNFFKMCEYHNLCTVMLDVATEKSFDQIHDTHEELSDLYD
jgi:hypothetical protein